MRTSLFVVAVGTIGTGYVIYRGVKAIAQDVKVLSRKAASAFRKACNQ